MDQLKCLFCSETKLTREHVWPDWICKDRQLRIDYVHVRRDKVAGTEWRTRKNSLTRRCLCVCEKCNTGRMKDIEDATKPILQPMIHGNHPSSLSYSDQKTLARWVSLRSIIFNTYAADKTSDLFFEDDERARFLASDEPLPYCLVLLATAFPSVRVDGEPSFLSIRPNVAPKFSGVRFFELTGLIRQVAFQAVIGKKDWLSGLTINANSPLGQIVKPIWPCNGARRWPPTGLLGKFGYESLKGFVADWFVAQNRLPGEGD